MARIALEEAQRHLLDLILSISPGEEVEIEMGDLVIAKLVRVSSGPRRLGSAEGSILYMAPDFDAPLEDFKEYME
jgi:antitoxin (DNA-binding transcriptional repressor) of toxin-antitoxin stability system